MRLTPKLLSFLPRFFRKDPDRFLALRLRYRWGAMKWTVSDAVLTTTVTGGPGQNLAVDLTQYTLAELVNHLAAQPGYRVVYADNSERALLSARVLLDGSGDQDASNGDHLYGYTSLLWSYLEAQAVEQQEAKAQIDNAIAQMSTRTASGEWLDEWGGYYGVPRRPGELDESYGPRIIATILRPRGNNVAIEMAISAYTGQETRVRDVTQWSEGFNLYDGSIAYDGQETHDSSAVPQYGLFDVEYGYNLLSGTDFSEFADIVRGLVERLRDAGTHLRAIALKGGSISDTFTPPTDGGITSLAGALALEDEFSEPSDDALSGELTMAVVADSFEAPDEDEVFATGYSTVYSGFRTYDGSVPHASGGFIVEPAPAFFAPLVADILSYADNGVVLDAAGSVYCEYTLIGNPPAKATLLSLGDTPILTIDVDGTVEFTDGVNTASVAHVFAGQTTRIGARWGQEGIQLFVDENASNPVAYSGTLPRSEGVFTIGNILDGSMPAWGWIRNVAVWRRDLGPNVLQALTRGVVTP